MNPVNGTTDSRAAKPFGKAGIIGLGLIGGSIARAVSQRAGLPVVGLDLDRTVLDAAIEEGVLERGAVIAPDDKPGAVADPKAWLLLRDCDVVFVCTPAHTVARLVHLASDYCPGLLTDVAGIKQPILEQVTSDRFIGGHPMAGSERQGYRFSSETLLENAVYVLCLPAETRLPYTTLRKFEALIRLIGATPVVLDAEEPGPAGGSLRRWHPDASGCRRFQGYHAYCLF